MTITLLLVKYIKSDCGPPAKPIGAQIDDEIDATSSTFQEGFGIEYSCRNGFVSPSFDYERTCVRGKWEGSTNLKCGKNLTIRIITSIICSNEKFLVIKL